MIVFLLCVIVAILLLGAEEVIGIAFVGLLCCGGVLVFVGWPLTVGGIMLLCGTLWLLNKPSGTWQQYKEWRHANRVFRPGMLRPADRVSFWPQ